MCSGWSGGNENVTLEEFATDPSLLFFVLIVVSLLSSSGFGWNGLGVPFFYCR